MPKTRDKCFIRSYSLLITHYSLLIQQTLITLAETKNEKGWLNPSI
ncbi:MAG: hypothetical protein F6K47_02855 [Symploca sp. SIO2E6]|nr:hypothetical protein [Symploca sp. SIO2E6]